MLEETKFRKYIIVMLCISLLLNLVFLVNLNSDMKTKDQFIRYSYPSLMYLLVEELKSLEEVSQSYSFDKTETLEYKNQKINEMTYRVYLITSTLRETNKLNKHFHRISYNLTEFFIRLNEDIQNNKLLSEEQNQTLNEIIQITKQYGGGPSRRSSYETNPKKYKRMKMPKETELFFEKIDSIL
ncbi:MAG: hypothetical protein JJT76_10825 [Clostridiaceae bacterium]|nr:hypothetical protein [Clostridiaceae bacterium]